MVYVPILLCLLALAWTAMTLTVIRAPETPRGPLLLHNRNTSCIPHNKEADLSFFFCFLVDRVTGSLVQQCRNFGGSRLLTVPDAGPQDRSRAKGTPRLAPALQPSTQTIPCDPEIPLHPKETPMRHCTFPRFPSEVPCCPSDWPPISALSPSWRR